MALLAAARRATTSGSLRRRVSASLTLRRCPTLSAAQANSLSSSSSSSEQKEDEDPVASLFRTWASLRAEIDYGSAKLQELRLCGALGSEIQSRAADRAPAPDLPSLRAQIEATTDYFPFEISENKCGNAITLTRALKGEQIEVVVSMRSIDNEVGQDHDETENESPSSSLDENAEEDKKGEADTTRSTMYLVVTVSKGDGSNLEFGCFARPDKVEICTMNMEPPITKLDEDDGHDLSTYEGFEGLDENLQKSFHEYLDLRGVTPKMMNLLRGYLSRKLQRKHTLWLTNLQDFVKKND